jgi:hypothetical protein
VCREIGSSLLDLLGSNMHDRSLKIRVLTELFQSFCLLFQLLSIGRLEKLTGVLISTLIMWHIEPRQDPLGPAFPPTFFPICSGKN